MADAFYRLPFPVFQASLGNRIKEKWPEICVISLHRFKRKGWDMKSCYVSLRKNPAGSPENKKVTREKARASVNICFLRLSKSNIHCGADHEILIHDGASRSE